MRNSSGDPLLQAWRNRQIIHQQRWEEWNLSSWITTEFVCLPLSTTGKRLQLNRRGQSKRADLVARNATTSLTSSAQVTQSFRSIILRQSRSSILPVQSFYSYRLKISFRSTGFISSAFSGRMATRRRNKIGNPVPPPHHPHTHTNPLPPRPLPHPCLLRSIFSVLTYRLQLLQLDLFIYF